MSLGMFHKEFPPNSVEARIKGEILQLSEEHDEPYIESTLKAAMENLKKRQKYANELAKQKRFLEQSIEELINELSHLKGTRAKKEEVCRELDEFAKLKQQVNAKMRSNLPEMREASKKTFYERLKDAQDTFDVKRREIAKQKDESDALSTLVESLEQEYDAMHTKIATERKERLEEINNMLVKNQSFASEVDDLHAQLGAVVREKGALQSSMATLKEQLAAYEVQYDYLANSSVNPEDVQKLVDTQKVDHESQLEYLQQQKTEAVNLRSKLEKELAELRARHVSVKKELPELERTRALAEKKCRQAQELLQKYRKTLAEEKK